MQRVQAVATQQTVAQADFVAKYGVMELAAFGDDAVVVGVVVVVVGVVVVVVDVVVVLPPVSMNAKKRSSLHEKLVSNRSLSPP